jgi:hypothetical protein
MHATDSGKNQNDEISNAKRGKSGIKSELIKSDAHVKVQLGTAL